MERARVTVDLSKKLNDKLGDIADELGTTRADLVRTALELLIAAKGARDQGLVVGAWGTSADKQTRIEQLFVNPVTSISD